MLVARCVGQVSLFACSLWYNSGCISMTANLRHYTASYQTPVTEQRALDGTTLDVRLFVQY